ncbi:ubiquinol-cytochrome c reductase cytochrome c1 subunit [Limimonas halophila]|uniref:Cytochrome c1 n=1 Tax=Limimonas halophila TaxID=1082479 RepID=A0A1G7LCF3_9PROT|nr:cytochrome c1 [Limimonas halophila]SDF47168.1 ubiquinol-cytochrome c reductase cytochrome c1 subunit [Limimonas halophila]
MKKLLSAASVALLALAAGVPAQAAGEGKIADHEFGFEGIFGTIDRAAAQRGLQVYNEVCAQCHSLKRVAFRSLKDLGYTEEQVEGIAAQYKVTDGPNDQGEMYERTAEPKDFFPEPFKNDKAAAAVYGVAPPDLSLMTQARPDGANYLYALLTGYEEAPEDFDLPQGAYYNTAFPGHAIKMPAPLSDGQVNYQDGTEATVAQMAHDVTVFLHWAAEPHMEERKRMGIGVVLFLLVFTGVLYATKRKIWRDLH